MGTILANPYELNFANTARNAESVERRADTFTRGDTRYDVVDSVSTACNALSNYTVYIMKITTVSTGATKYKVQYTMDGRNPIDSNQVRSSGPVNGFNTLAEAQAERTTFVEDQNAFRTEPGCGDSSALNYSPISPSSGPCPCKTSEAVWDSNKSWQDTPTLQTVAETAGDCTCIYPPEYTEGGYIVEKWTYKGQPATPKYDPNPPYAQILHEWEWEEVASKSNIPQSGLEDNLYRIANPGYRATGLTTQEYIVKTNLMATSWKKYRVITATGFERIGCMDSTAKNYVSDATTTDPNNPCEFCEDSDPNAAGYDQESGKCLCKAGYKRGFLGKCVKDTKKAGSTPSPDPTPEEGSATGLLMGVVGLTAVGIVISTAIAAQKRGEQP